MAVGTRIQHRRDTAANWAANNPVLLQGEPGFETDTGFEKRGDGSTNWNSLSYQKINAITFLPLPTGVASTDTANLNAVLARGGFIRPNPLAVSAAYTINAALILADGGNTDVDFGGCTITMAAGLAGHLLETSAYQTTGRNIPDVQVTSGQANVTCVQGPYQGGGSAYEPQTGFLASDVGKNVVVRDNSRPQANGDLSTTITAVSSNTLSGTNGGYATGTLNTAPGFTPTGGSPAGVTFLSVGPRDQNIRVRGGTWIRNTVTSNPQGPTVGMLWFSRCDNLTIRDIKISTQTTGSWQLVIEDSTNFTVDNITGATTYAVAGGGTDLVHVSGPATNGTISCIYGSTGDDAVGLNAYVAAGARSCAGPISKLTVRDIFADGQSANTVSFWTSDWYNATCDDITVESCRPVQTTAGAGFAGCLAAIQTFDQHQINCGKIRFMNCSGCVLVASNGAPSSSGNGTVAGLELVNHSVDSWMVPANTAVVKLYTAVTVSNIQITGFIGTFSNSSVSLVRVDGSAQITSLLIDNFRLSGSGTGVDCVDIEGATGAIRRTIVRGGEIQNTGINGQIIAELASGANAGEIWLSDIYTDNYDIAYLQSNTTRNVNANNINAVGNVGFWIAGTDTVTFRGANVNSPAHTLNSNSNAVGKVKIPDMLADASWIASTLQNSWGNLGSGFTTAGYRKNGQGVVYLKGILSGGTATAGTVLFTLPAGYRPAEHKVYEVACAGAVEIRVMNNGNVQIGSLTNADSISYLSLDNIAFIAEQ